MQQKYSKSRQRKLDKDLSPLVKSLQLRKRRSSIKKAWEGDPYVEFLVKNDLLLHNKIATMPKFESIVSSLIALQREIDSLSTQINEKEQMQDHEMLQPMKDMLERKQQLLQKTCSLLKRVQTLSQPRQETPRNEKALNRVDDFYGSRLTALRDAKELEQIRLKKEQEDKRKQMIETRRQQQLKITTFQDELAAEYSIKSELDSIEQAFLAAQSSEPQGALLRRMTKTISLPTAMMAKQINVQRLDQQKRTENTESSYLNSTPYMRLTTVEGQRKSVSPA